MSKFKKSLLLIFILSNLYGILCGGLYFFQDNLILHPRQLPQDFVFNFKNHFKEVWIEASDGAKLNGLHFTVDNPKGVILYYHGNAGSLATWGEIAQYFVNKDYDLIIMDYRQFGKSSGVLSENKLYEDSLEWYHYAKSIYPEGSILVYGRSLGTTFAAYVASQNKVEKLILETPFYSIENEAKSRFSWLPVGKLLKYKFPTFEYINKVKAPVTIFHGTSDAVVNYDHGKQLFDSIESGAKKLITIPNGGHNNLIEFTEYQEAIEDLL